MLITDKPYFEHVINFEGTHNDVHDEEALHLLRIDKLMHFMENHQDGEYGQEVLEFILQTDDDGTLKSRVRFLTDAKSKTNKYESREVSLTLEDINNVYELNFKGENLALYKLWRRCTN